MKAPESVSDGEPGRVDVWRAGVPRWETVGSRRLPVDAGVKTPRPQGFMDPVVARLLSFFELPVQN